ncbi:MAG TPA: translation initiation factor IF-2 [Polyangia bacterium]|jgi:translation initiation factor IF-2|nr:translation initiation factor IF-2 [Polyangia bacterium]
MIGSGYERRSEASSSHDDAAAAPRVRVYEMAKELGLANRDLVSKIRALGIEVANHMSHIETADVDRIRRALDRERQESLVEERLSDTVIRRRSKTAPQLPAKPATPPPAPPAAAAPEARARVSAPEPTPAPVVREAPAASAAAAAPAPRVETAPSPAVREPEAAPATSPEASPRRRVVEAPSAAPAAERPIAAAAAAAPLAAPPAPEPARVPIAARAPEPSERSPGTAPGPTPPAPAPQPVLRQISSPVVTGSAATGAFIQLPGMPPRGEAGVPKIEIKDRDEELRRLGRTGLINRTPAGRDRYGRPAFGAPGQRPGAPPRKRVAAAGKKIKKTEITTPAEHKRVVRMGETIAVSDLAQKMGIKGKEVIKKLWALGMMGVNINQDIDLDTATLIATEFGYQIESTAFNEEEVIADGETQDAPEDLVPRAPVVTIMGHVDHGKTSLLDAIRKANVAEGEAGGITQHIGAYKVRSERGDVVFLDTPGHEAFTAMRARGAQMTDIVVLVVAADDGPMPQTIEAINHAKEAGVPILVAVNKIDKPGANPEIIRNKLSEHGLVSEEWGGETIYVNVSAKTKQGIDKLLDMLALQAEVLELKANPNRAGKGHVVEARLDRARGPISTILVEEGTLRLGDLVVAGEFSGKVRAMLGDLGQSIAEAGPSTPVEVLGLDGVPDAGETFNVVDDEKAAKSLVEHRRDTRRKKDLAGTTRVSLENILDKIKAGEVKEVKIVLKADVQGSIEAVANALTNLSTDAVGVNVISTGVGGITESDVSLAKASAAVIIGFNVRPAGKSQQLAEQEGVDIKLYQVIYDAIDDVKKAMVGMLSPVLREKVMGRAEVRQVFSIPKAGNIAGTFVVDGKVTRKAQVRLIRDSVVVFTGKVGSLRRFKDDASEVTQGYECGISIEGYNDVKEGDVIEAFEIESVAPTLESPTGAPARR